MLNRSVEPGFELWLEQSLAKLDLLPGRTPDDQGPLPLEPDGYDKNLFS